MRAASAVFVLGAALLFAGPVRGTVQQTTWHDPALGYSLAYDADCKFTVNQHKNSADKSEWFLECNRKTQQQVWNLSLTVDMATTYPDARLIAQELTGSLKRDIPGLVVAHDPSAFAPLPGAYTFDWTATQRGTHVHGAQYLQLSAHPQRVFIFTASSPATLYGPSHQGWEHVLSTFKFDY